MPLALSYEVKLHWAECGECGAPIAFTEDHYNRLRADNDGGRGWWCPRGHNRLFRGTRVTELEKSLANTQQRLKWAEEGRAYQIMRAETAERSRSALRGALTRTRKRVAAGVCPCCQRTFQQLARHMAAKHPDYGPEEKSVA